MSVHHLLRHSRNIPENSQLKEIPFQPMTDFCLTKNQSDYSMVLNYEVSKNEHITNEDKNKQIHSQIKIHNKHLKNITRIDKYKKTEQYFYDGAQNRTQVHFGEPSNKHTQIQQRSNKGN